MNTSSFFFIPREGTDYSNLFKRVRLLPLYSFPHIKDFNLSKIEHKDRFFIHFDFDAFFAQVEQRDNPNLRGKPVSVGGTPGGKGIVMTASYEARALGIETGMSVWQAKKICPELISVPCYGPKYEHIMHNLLRILLSYAPQDCIEQYSVDECFIDVSTVAKNFDEARNIAAAIKRDVRQAEKLMVSAGISYNKTFAKLATKFKKPDGLTVITQNDKERLYKLSVKKIWGIGRRIERRLNVMNIITIGDLANTRPGILKKEFGVNGLVLRRLARGEDTSEIFRRNMHEKCLNHNHTLSQTVYKPEDVRKEIRRMGEYICRKLRTKELVAGALFLTLRYWDLRYAGDDIKLKTFTNDDRDIYEAALSILPRFPVPSKERQVRMFGIGVFNLHTDNKSKNLELFNQKIVLPYTSLDKLKYKYGENIIRVGIAT